MENQENKPEKDEYIPVENVSFSFVFFLMSGALLLVTLWSFWDDEYYRRGYKDYQEEYFKAQYTNAEKQWKAINEEIKGKEQEIKQALENEEGKLESSPEYNRLLEEVQKAKIHLDEEKGKRKFAISRLDEAYYYYKKAMHEGENYDVEKAKVHELEQEIKNLHEPIIDKLTKVYEEKEDALLKFKAKQASLEKELSELTKQRDQLAREMDFYKPFPFFWKPAEILQTVIPGYGVN
ncbi:MAG: cytochrome C, partial [Nitrospinales bacterium]